MKKAKKHLKKIYKLALFTIVPVLCMSSFVFGFFTFSISDKSNESPSNVSYQSVLSDRSCGDKSIVINPLNNYEGSFMNYPTPRYRPLAVSSISSSYNLNYYWDFANYCDRSHYKKGEVTPTSGYQDRELYNSNDYKNFAPLQNFKIGFRFLNDGSVRLIGENYNTDGPKTKWKEFKNNSGANAWVYNFIADYIIDDIGQSYYPICFGSWEYAPKEAFYGERDYSPDVTDIHNYFGLSSVGISNSGSTYMRTSRMNFSRTYDVDYFTGIELNGRNYRVNSSFYPVSIDANNRNSMVIVRIKRNVGFDFARKNNERFDWFKYYHGMMPSSLQLSVENGSNGDIYVFRQGKLNGTVGVTGANNVRTNQYDVLRMYVSGGSSAQDLLLSGFSNVPDSESVKQKLDEMIYFSAYHVDNHTGWQRHGETVLRTNLPMFYSDIDDKWYLISDRFLFNDNDSVTRKPFTISLESNFDRNIKPTIYPSQFIDGILNGTYSGSNAKLSLTIDNSYKEYYWTTPSSWFRYNPVYKVSSNDKKGELEIKMKMLYFNSSWGQPRVPWGDSYVWGANASSRNLLTFADTPRTIDINFTIRGFKSARTSFTDVSTISLGNDFNNLASNISEINFSEILNAIKSKFMTNIGNYVDSYCYLDLSNNDIVVNSVSNDLLSGNAVISVTLKKYIDSNGVLVENSNNFKKEYTIGNFYKINGRTTLNNSIVNVEDKYASNVASSISGDTIKNLIIDYQAKGVDNTIKSNFSDKSKEIFANLGNLLSYKPEYFSIVDETNDDDKGIKYVKFRLSKIYDTSINNSGLIDVNYEGVIMLCGFKSKSAPLNNFNSTTIYADNKGYIGRNNNNNQVINTNGDNFNPNNQTISNNKLTLSQQYLGINDSRVALEYDFNSPNKIIISTYNGNSLIKEYRFDSLVSKKLVLRKDSILYYDSLDSIIKQIGGINYYKSDGTRIDKNSLSNYVVSNGVVDDYNNSFKVKEDIYADLYVDNNLAFNRMIDFNSSINGVSRMFIYNQSPINNVNNILDALRIVEFTSTSAWLVSINQNSSLSQSLQYNALYSASGTYDFYDGKPVLNASFIKAYNNRTFYTRLIIDAQSYNLIKVVEIDITNNLNLFSNGNILCDSFYFQMPEFVTVNTNSYGVISFLIATVPIDNINYSSAKQRLITIKEKSNNSSIVNFKVLSQSSIKDFNCFSNKTFSIINSSLTSNGTEWLSTVIEKDNVYFMNINIIDYLSKGAFELDNTFITILNPDQSKLDKKDFSNNWVYSLNNNCYQKYKVSTNNNNLTDVSISQIMKTIKISDIGISNNTSLYSITKENVASAINNNYWKLFSNKNVKDAKLSVDSMYKNYNEGTLIANVNLDYIIDSNFVEKTNSSFDFIIKGFTPQKNATSISLTSSGEQFFSKVSFLDINAKLNEIIKDKNLLDSYFALNNHPTSSSLYDVLPQFFPITNDIKFDFKNNKAYIGFNIQGAYVVNDNDSVVFQENQTIYVEIPTIAISNISDIRLDYTNVFANNQPISPSELREELLSNPNGPSITKIKNAILAELKKNNLTISADDIMISKDIQYDNGIGEIYMIFSIPKLAHYSIDFINAKLTIFNMKASVGTIITKRQDYKRNINPSKINEYLHQNLNVRAYDFINIENKRSDTQVIAANVINFNDELGTATISFSIINFNLSGLNQSGSSEGTTLNATFEYTNLRGVNSESITNVQSIVNAPEKFANQYAQSISTNNEALSNILVDTNAITSLPDDAKISILSSRFDNKTGKIYLSFKINKYISNLGEIIDKELSFDTTIIGFKQCPDKTTVTWNNVLPDLTYYELIAELKNNPNFVTNLVTVNNMVDGATFTFAKAIEIDENTTDVYMQLNKCFSGDEFNTILFEAEFKIRITKNATRYLVNRYSIVDKENSSIIEEDFYDYYSDVVYNQLYSYWYWFIIGPLLFISFVLLIWGLAKKYNNNNYL